MYRLKAYARATYRAPGQLSLVRLVQILVNSLAFYCPFIHADSGRCAQEANAHQSVDFLSDVFNSTVFTCCLDQFISTMDCIEQQCSDTVAVWSFLLLEQGVWIEHIYAYELRLLSYWWRCRRGISSQVSRSVHGHPTGRRKSPILFF